MKKLSLILLIFTFFLSGVGGGLIYNAYHTNDFLISKETTNKKIKNEPVLDFDDSNYIQENWLDKASESYAGGSGTKEDPYQISNERELAFLTKNCYEIAGYSRNKHFVLTDNINLNDGYFEENGTYHDGGDGKLNVWQPIGCTKSSNHYFKNATFNGNGFVINGVYINATTGACGLFGYTTDVIIQNVKVRKSYVKATGSSVGGVVASVGLNTSQVLNCSYDGFVYSESIYVGGVIGAVTNVNVLISGCENYGNVFSNGAQSIGGVVGWGYYGNRIEKCVNYGNVEAPKAYDAGGICGHGKVFDSVNYGTIYSNSSAGGIAGCGLQVENSQNYGTIEGDSSVGGIVGNARNLVSNSHNYGAVSSVLGGDNIGGICGVSYANVIQSNNFGKISGRNYVGGVAGQLNSGNRIIVDCLNYGNVEGGSHIGGVVGYLKNGVLQYCKNVADVEVRSIRFGGVVGWVENSSKVYNSLSVSKVKGVEANEIYYTNLKLFYIDPKMER